MNTFFQKAPREQATFKLVGAQGNREPWTTDIWAELDLCLVRQRWHNTRMDVKADPYTDIATYHKMPTVRIKQHSLKP
eukprot:16234196-Heterocapsa_arctica.AAC.1